MDTPEVHGLADAFVDDAFVDALVEHIAATLPSERSQWPPAWPEEAEAALLDAVFSARATYGTPRTGVRRVIENWRCHRGTRLDDISALADFADTPDRLAEILGNRQRVPGNYTTKAEATALAAAGLVHAGIDTSRKLSDGRGAWSVITAIPGLGTTTWETFVLRLGLIGPRTLEALCMFVTEATGSAQPVTESHALELLAGAAETADLDPAALLNAVWRHQRARAGRRAPKPLSA
ncbi:hypothetical protein [Rhodococcus sp. W8901]|uniref:hypothetical protein n=1 Tax=Rhodococcus sp. W8901 TaxID=2742603 RepID=UPI0015825542|nr:hypothetical protein [Rhodococcus sp. W8901]QKT12320.1 hypothetical protein HUN07_17845 [Rhodococcus sp. W8901]